MLVTFAVKQDIFIMRMTLSRGENKISVITISISWYWKFSNISKNHLKRVISLDALKWSLVLWIWRSDRLTGGTGSAVAQKHIDSALWRVRLTPKCPEDGLPWSSSKTWWTRDSWMTAWSEDEPELSCRLRYKISFSRTRCESCQRRRRRRGVCWRTSLTVGWRPSLTYLIIIWMSLSCCWWYCKLVSWLARMKFSGALEAVVSLDWGLVDSCSGCCVADFLADERVVTIPTACGVSSGRRDRASAFWCELPLIWTMMNV